MFLRGVADSPFNGASQSTVAVLLDDTRLTYSAPDPDLRLVDVDRVELLEGPQGSLYGTGALGGIYHVVTRRADLDRFAATVSAGVGAVVDGGTSVSGSAVVNLPVLPGKLGLRLVAYQANEPGWIDSGARRDANLARVSGGRGALGFDAGGGWRLDLSGLVQRLDTRDSQYTYATHAYDRPAQLPEPHDNDLDHAAARLAGAIGAVDAVLVTGYTWHEVQDTLDATVGATGFGLADPQLFRDSRKFRVWDSELRLTGRLGAIRWLAGISHVEASENETRDLQSAKAGLTIDTSHRTSIDSGLFGDATLPLTGRLDLEVGGRLFRSVLDADSAAAGAQVARETSRFGLTPSLALAWRRRAGRLLYVRYGSAFRQGGLGSATGGRERDFAGDELATLEAGWREQLPGGGQLDAGAFLTWWDDMQSDMLAGNGVIETRNAGKARIAGAQMTLTEPLGDNWQVVLGAVGQATRLVRNDLGIVLDDSRLPAIPDYTLRAAVQRGFTLGPARGSVRMSLRYVGPARLSFDPALDRAMGRVLESRLDGWIDWGRTRLDVRVDNLFNRSSNLFAFGNPFRIATAQFTPQRPTSATITLTRVF